MHVDVDVEFAGELEDAMDLAGLVRVVARRAADHLGAAPEALDHQLVGPRIVGQAFLRKHADLDVDRPFVVGDQRLHAFEAAHADAGIDLDLRAHAGGAVHDALLEGALGARAHVLDRHVFLERRDALDRAERAALLRRAAVDDARLVEMDVGLDQARDRRGIRRRRRFAASAASARSIATMRPCSTPISSGPSAERSASRALRMTKSTRAYSALMSAALISGHHFSISAL